QSALTSIYTLSLHDALPILGYFIRIESALLITAVVLPPFVLFSRLRFKILRYLSPVFVLIGVLSVLLNINFTQADKDYAALRPYQFILWDFSDNYQVDGLITKKDSVKFDIAKQKFFADPDELNPEFFDRIGVIKADKTPSGIFTLIKNAQLSKVSKYFDAFFIHTILLVANLALVIGVFVTFGFSEKINLIFIGVYSLLILFLTAWIMKMEPRI